MLGGCLRTIGCGTVLVIAAGVAWITRDRWYPALRDGGGREVELVEGATPLSDSGADRAAEAIRALGQPSGPAYVNLSPADVAALILREAERRAALPLKDATAVVVDERLRLAGLLDLRELRAQGTLGALGPLLGDDERVEMRGTLQIVQPGLAQFRVETFKARDFNIPSAVIPRLISQLHRGPRPEGVSRDAIPFPVPAHIGDVRIANGRVTLYKTVNSR